MTEKRFVVDGTRPDCGEVLTGYVLYPDNLLPGKAYICAGIESAESIDGGYLIGRFFEVDPASVEPVAVKVLRETGIIHSERCPNCHVHVSDNTYMQKYCDHCGQRLDWGGEDDGTVDR